MEAACGGALASPVTMKQALLKAKRHSFSSAKGEMRGAYFAFDDYDESKPLFYVYVWIASSGAIILSVGKVLSYQRFVSNEYFIGTHEIPSTVLNGKDHHLQRGYPGIGGRRGEEMEREENRQFFNCFGITI